MNLAATRRNWPSGRGFERWYGFLGAETNQWHPDLVYFDVFDFDLTAEQLSRVDALDTGVRNGPDPDLPRPEIFDRLIPED